MSLEAHFPLLDLISHPAELRRLPTAQLPQFADELRDCLIHTVSRCGGHFAAGLGTVELTVALHYVFNTPDDRLVWDVGHQTYPHKIVTGRRQRLHTIRQWEGIAPFPKREESPFDSFGVGHSSTSISAALGMALGMELMGKPARHAVAVIGDGAMTAGMAFEALNHAGHLKANLLVILNDNEMSISPNVGALSAALTKTTSSRLFYALREEGKRVLQHMPTPLREMAKRAEAGMKGLVIPGTLFEEMGFHYFGPIDGHDLPNLVSTLTNLRDLQGPRLLHLITRKGKGYGYAEAAPVKYHAVGVFDPQRGVTPSKPSNSPTYSQVFGDWLCAMAAKSGSLVAITPAMREGSGMVAFSEQFPARYHDVAIAEQHAVTLAAGMACEGARPVVAIYSTFLQRAYDQLIHDVALQNLPVLFAIDRAGVVGPDGPTHAGSFDLSFLRCIPNLIVMAPADEEECWQMLTTGYELQRPVAVRYPRGKGVGRALSRSWQTLELGKAEWRRRGKKIALLAFGAMVEVAEQVAEALDLSVINMRFVKPLDGAAIREAAASHEQLVTLEDNAVMGGAGSAVAEYLAAANLVISLKIIGLPDQFLEHGERHELLAVAGLDAIGIKRQLNVN